jgi:hypothetical protein
MPPDKKLQDTARKLYDLYGKLLEEQPWGEFVAISNEARHCSAMI